MFTPTFRPYTTGQTVQFPPHRVCPLSTLTPPPTQDREAPDCSITRLLNRLLGLHVGVQHEIFSYFMQILVGGGNGGEGLIEEAGPGHTHYIILLRSFISSW